MDAPDFASSFATVAILSIRLFVDGVLASCESMVLRLPGAFLDDILRFRASIRLQCTVFMSSKGGDLSLDGSWSYMKTVCSGFCHITGLILCLILLEPSSLNFKVISFEADLFMHLGSKLTALACGLNAAGSISFVLLYLEVRSVNVVVLGFGVLPE